MAERKRVPEWMILRDRLFGLQSDSPRIRSIYDARATGKADVLYHYTDQRGLTGILQSGSVWATDTRFLNDQTEFVHGAEIGRESVKDLVAAIIAEPLLVRMRETAENVERRPTYVFCLSTTWDSLSQWRAYGGSGTGYALGFKQQGLSGVGARSDGGLTECVYDEQLQKELLSGYAQIGLARYSEESVDPSRDPAQCLQREIEHWARLVNHFPIALKDPSFSEEREWRLYFQESPKLPLLSVRQGGRTLVPHLVVPLQLEGQASPLTEIVIGPSPDGDLCKTGLAALLQSIGSVDVVIRSSETPYRNW
jgi:hypothetical protein